MDQQRWTRRLAAGLAGLGGTAVVLLAVLALEAAEPWPVVPALLPLAFLLAGVVGTRARPDHPGLLLLLAVGTLHLTAFAVSGWVSISVSRLSTTAAWALALVAEAAYLTGFAALALLLGLYPSGRARTRSQRWLVRTVPVLVAMGLVVDALLQPRLDLVLGGGITSVAVPSPLPLVESPIPGLLPVLMCVPAAVLVLALSGRRLPEAERRAVSWARLGGVLLALLLLATPVLEPVVGTPAWAALFLLMGASLPVLLLAGLVRYRLLSIDLLVVRTVSRGVVVLGVLVLYAAAAAALGERGFWPIAALVTAAAVLTGTRTLRTLEALADRWITGRRVGVQALREDLADVLALEHQGAPERVRRAVQHGLDVAWVRICSGGTVLAGNKDDQAMVTVPLVADGDEVGTLEAGPRRGGWRAAELDVLQRVADQLALVLRQQQLSRELADRVQELLASRRRLVRAEDDVRRRMERDLHDGVQQQLVGLLAMLAVTAAQLPEQSPAAEQLRSAQQVGREALADLRRLVSGIHPAVLEDRGLTAAIEARIAQLPIAVRLDIDPRVAESRFGQEVESAAFYLVCEALSNVVKHSGSEHARVVISPLGDGLRVAVVDEGCGMVPGHGTGLRGLRDRVEAVGGTLAVQSVRGVGTTVVAEIASARAALDA